MMKLILSLSLIWMLSSTAAALQCLTKNLFSNDTVLQPCESDDELCATIARQDLQIEKGISRSCVPSFLCGQIFSQSFVDWKTTESVHCCNTDGCNNQHVPYLDVDAKNGLQCVSCLDHQSSVCNETIECVGVQDRCFSFDVTDDDDTFHVRGCVSASMCEVFPLLIDRPGFNFTGELKCCGTSFCNSAVAIKLSVVPVLLGLIALIVY